MRVRLTLTVVLAVCLVAGCTGHSPNSKEVRDRVVWVEEGIAHQDVVIGLGYRADFADGALGVEPVTKITRDGAAVANAMVFNALVAADSHALIGGEAATVLRRDVYRGSPAADGPYYAQGVLHPPRGTAQCVVRFRIVLPDSQDAWTREVLIPIE